MLGFVLLLLLCIPVGLYLWASHNRDYWKRKNVPFIPGQLFWGNIKKIILLKINPAEEFDKFYWDDKTKDEPYVGINSFYKPMLLVKEPELIKRILVKDFNLFADRQWTSSPHTDGLSYYNLFFINNPVWKELRSRLTPVFTSGKMKQLFYLVDEVGTQLNTHLKTVVSNTRKNVDIKDVCSSYTTDSISSCAFGIQANSISDPKSEFRSLGKEALHFTWLRGFEFLSLFFIPDIIRLFNFKVFHNKLANLLRSSVDFVMKEREKTKTVKNDLIDSLILLKNEDKDKVANKLNIVFKGDMIYAQAAVFFLAGYETSSSAMSFALYEIAMQPEIQEKLRNDIKEMLQKNNGKVTYDSVTTLPYLDMIIKETLRMYPPLPFLDRVCQLPQDQNGYSLEPYGDFKIPNNLPVVIPFLSLHRDPKYFSNPNKFDPERFSPENESNINPYVYMPFGRGPRNCIGDRFGLLQAKVGLVHILKDFYVAQAKNTINPMKLEPKALLLQAEGGIFLDLVSDPLIK